ncbi:hypothetical protein BD324DRAFT_624052 [Kockovaella imperatae]|uniref:Uncharacterized protein n=1 Tax=Kockovaella imperatae TaxID=4999 RepID=A0A1Y1UKJ1_9TREE|nr:hypothetical protein BD324DRAFT_624052 [Kockovaella imperatae]ORX37986.1 hypothetical protein BD324DRAFT_624052 [Kockovaella imperatae]
MIKRRRRSRRSDLEKNRLVIRPISTISSSSSFASPNPIAWIRPLPPIRASVDEKGSTNLRLSLSSGSSYDSLQSETLLNPSLPFGQGHHPTSIGKATRISQLRLARGTFASLIPSQPTPSPLRAIASPQISGEGTLRRISMSLGWERRQRLDRPPPQRPPSHVDLDLPPPLPLLSSPDSWDRPRASFGPSHSPRSDIVAEFTISPFGEFMDLPYSARG